MKIRNVVYGLVCVSIVVLGANGCSSLNKTLGITEEQVKTPQEQYDEAMFFEAYNMTSNLKECYTDPDYILGYMPLDNPSFLLSRKHKCKQTIIHDQDAHFLGYDPEHVDLYGRLEKTEIYQPNLGDLANFSKLFHPFSKFSRIETFIPYNENLVDGKVVQIYYESRTSVPELALVASFKDGYLDGTLTVYALHENLNKLFTLDGLEFFKTVKTLNLKNSKPRSIEETSWNKGFLTSAPALKTIKEQMPIFFEFFNDRSLPRCSDEQFFNSLVKNQGKLLSNDSLKESKLENKCVFIDSNDLGFARDLFFMVNDKSIIRSNIMSLLDANLYNASDNSTLLFQTIMGNFEIRIKDYESWKKNHNIQTRFYDLFLYKNIGTTFYLEGYNLFFDLSKQPGVELYKTEKR